MSMVKSAGSSSITSLPCGNAVDGLDGPLSEGCGIGPTTTKARPKSGGLSCAVVSTGVDPVTSHFSGERSAD
jgi:hypothetical protein